MPSATTLRTPAKVVSRHWRAGCKESLHAQFGEGPTEKGRANGTSPAVYSTSRTPCRDCGLRPKDKTAVLTGDACTAVRSLGRRPQSRHGLHE